MCHAALLAPAFDLHDRDRMCEALHQDGGHTDLPVNPSLEVTEVVPHRQAIEQQMSGLTRSM